MLRGGAVISIDQAKTAESAGACCLTVTESTLMPDPHLVKTIQRSVSNPVMFRCRVGHFIEAQILESIGKFGFLVIWMRMRFLLLRRRWLGCDGVFVGNEVFECLDPYTNVRSIVEVIRNYNNARILAKVSSGLSDMGASGMELNEVNELNDAMNGVNIDENENNEVIMEYLVKVNEKAHILELKRRNMKITNSDIPIHRIHQGRYGVFVPTLH
ncbi:pyridoxal 5'-phosphate synthase-like subunit PDX1.2 [Tanacetum coccineum]